MINDNNVKCYRHVALLTPGVYSVLGIETHQVPGTTFSIRSFFLKKAEDRNAVSVLESTILLEREPQIGEHITVTEVLRSLRGTHFYVCHF